MSLSANELNTYTNVGNVPVFYAGPNSTIHKDPPPDAPIYYYGGHGTDLCDPDTHFPITDIVPPNCIYVTIAVCGERTNLKFGEESEEHFFRSSDPAVLAILKNPGDPLNKKKFAKAMNVRVEDVHIKYPGERYVRSHLGPFGFWFNTPFETHLGRSALALSGLINVRTLAEISPSSYYDRPIEKFQRNYLNKTMLGIDFLKYIGKLYDHNQETLNYAKEEINIFMEEKKKIIGRKDLTIHTFKFKPPEGTYILSKLDTWWSIEEILAFFEASVYPTQEYMKEFFKQTYPGRTRMFGGEFPTIAYKLEKAISPGNILDSFSKLSNTYLMKTFPGIHYNVVCRVTHPRCFVGLQRSSSAHQENTHYGELPPTIEPTNEEIKPLIQSINTMRKTKYNTFTQKKKRIRNKLLEKTNLLVRMSNNQRQRIFNTLKANRVLNEQNNATQKPISKAIKHILFPKRYPITKGGSRKTNLQN